MNDYYLKFWLKIKNFQIWGWDVFSNVFKKFDNLSLIVFINLVLIKKSVWLLRESHAFFKGPLEIFSFSWWGKHWLRLKPEGEALMEDFCLSVNVCLCQFPYLSSFRWKTQIIYPGQCLNTLFFSYKNHVYKNVEAQITLKFKNVVVILLVAISISFWGSNQN